MAAMNYIATHVGEKLRFDDIAEDGLEQLGNVISAISMYDFSKERVISVPQSELLRSAAKVMGFARMTAAIETAMTAAVRIAVQRGQAKEENGKILLP